MTDESLRFEFMLKKEEKPLYQQLLKQEGYDPDTFLHGRRVVAPPEHYAELSDAAAALSGHELAREHEGLDSYEGAVEMVTNLMKKAANALHDAGDEARERADVAMAEMGYGESPDEIEDDIDL